MTGTIPQHPPTYWGLVEHRASDSPDRPLLSDEYGRVLTCAGTATKRSASPPVCTTSASAPTPS